MTQTTTLFLLATIGQLLLSLFVTANPQQNKVETAKA